jgi:HSP20 family protein
MAKQSRRRRTAQPKSVRQPQHRQARRNDEAGNSPSAPQVERTVAILQNAVAKANPFEPMERFMRALAPFDWFMPWIALPPAPKLDVIDRDSSVLVRAEVPGVPKNHLAVEASDESVTIKGEVQHDERREEEHYRLSETSRGMFERTVRLPTAVDSTRAKATFKDGVVEVMLPKVDRSRTHHLKL